MKYRTLPEFDDLLADMSTPRTDPTPPRTESKPPRTATTQYGVPPHLLNATPHQPAATPARPVRAVRRPWTDLDYQIRGLPTPAERTADPRVNLHTKVSKRVYDRLSAMAAEARMPIGAVLDKLLGDL